MPRRAATAASTQRGVVKCRRALTAGRGVHARKNSCMRNSLRGPPGTRRVVRGTVGTEELPAEHLASCARGRADPRRPGLGRLHHPHPAGSVDPVRDLEQLDLEFMLADLSMIDRRLERLHAGGGRHGTPAEREANEREEVILVALKAALEAGRPIRDETLDPDDEKAIRGFRFLTQKPVLVLLNLARTICAPPRRWWRIAAGTRRRPRDCRMPCRRGSRWSGQLEPTKPPCHGRAGPHRTQPGPCDRPVRTAGGPDLVPTAARTGPRLPAPRVQRGGRAGAITRTSRRLIRAETIGWESSRRGSIREPSATARCARGQDLPVRDAT